MSSIKPEVLKKFAAAVPEVIAAAAEAQEKEPPGFWEASRILSSRNLRRGLAIARNMLESLEKNSHLKKADRR
jgi:uncharacterized protein YjgD (DUF1641 family)